ncbi:carboxymuconolactone decarboxylase family protein [Carboxydothermus pertinax]|uniref:Carboxymuconolactone decarboxylase family protein n=1 Tax=Carboxydothermus pertinax TaxID=870242 RepID=A0A1L8CTV5_9THEO|nr:carboxymuconolactone decarboxylase family protein [Carboxydothermus pertinax]GAV22343.1 carboxymuconolactone decarboxylase family protein [Carboxydothermus pertinax]
MEPLIKPVAEEALPAEAKEIFAALKAKHEVVPPPLQVMAHNLSMLKLFTEKFKVLWEENPLDEKTKILIAYTISVLNNCAFCITNYTKQANDKGLTEKELLGVLALIDLVGSMNHFNNGIQLKP